MTLDVRRGLILLLALAAFGGLRWLVSYLARDIPTPRQACTQKCAATKQEGHLVTEDRHRRKSRTQIAYASAVEHTSAPFCMSANQCPALPRLENPLSPLRRPSG